MTQPTNLDRLAAAHAAATVELAYLARLADCAAREGYIAAEASAVEGPDEWCCRVFDEWSEAGAEYSPETLIAAVYRMASVNHWPALIAELRQLRAVEAERDKLRKALVEIANDPYQFGARIQALKRKARAALGGEHGK